MSADKNLHRQPTRVNRAMRERAQQHRGVILWFTGLSGAGKSTLAHAVEEVLHTQGCRTYVLDGDNVRHGLCADLEFSAEDRVENIRRAGEVAKLFLDAGVIVLTAFISPYRADRERARQLVDAGDFIEIWCASPPEVCEQRDVKGLYAKARQGMIPNFTGISAPYETPESAELVLDTAHLSLAECVERVLRLLAERGVV
ncbi:MAG: adenylyl-sulfate kinase [Methylobacillus sp.]|jgi:adenylylsulfate kinase|nr:adenylyl-sulfate kinase [Methylobacillus sp.]